jgi:hypothetical protein
MEKKLCETCRFYEYVGVDNCDGLESGLCHRYPPTRPPIAPENGDDVNSYPVVFEHSWCGEWGAVMGRKLRNPPRRKHYKPEVANG